MLWCICLMIIQRVVRTLYSDWCRQSVCYSTKCGLCWFSDIVLFKIIRTDFLLLFVFFFFLLRFFSVLLWYFFFRSDKMSSVRFDRTILHHIMFACVQFFVVAAINSSIHVICKNYRRKLLQRHSI